MTKKFAVIFGWIFIVLGILGLISNPIIGNAPGAFFAADTARSVINLLSGIIFLWIAYGSHEKSGKALKAFGIVYLIIAIIGFFSSTGTIFGLMTTNTADNWVALLFALVAIWASMSGEPVPLSQAV